MKDIKEGETTVRACELVPSSLACPVIDVFAGDALFQGGIGRFDLPGGDGKVLLASIREKLLTLPDDTMVLAGHGPTSTIGEEKRSNPFLLYPRMYMGIDTE